MREWFEYYLDACNRHDLEEIRGLLEPSVKRAHLPSGADAWIDDLDQLFRAFPDWRWRRIQLVIEEDRIAAHLRVSGTHANAAEFGFFRLANGRIAEFSGTTGHHEILAQLRG